MSRQEKLPTDWDRVKLRKLVAIDKESLGAKTPPDYEFLYASLSDVNSGVINRDLPLIKFSDAPSRARRKVKKGDVLFSTVRPNLEGYARINGQVNNLIASTGFAVLSPKKITDTDFIYQYLYSYDIKRQIYALVVGSNYPAVNSSDVANLKFSIPKSTSERQAIATLLSTWDEAIEKTEQLIVKKQKFYEAQLSKRLSLDVSERIKLKKFLKEVSKRNRDLSITQVLSVTNSKGFVRPEDQFDRQVASDNLSNYKIVSKGEYAYNPSRINVGSIARLDGWDVGVLSPMYTVFEIKKPSELHTDLFLHWLNSHEAKQRIKLSAQGSVRETVSFDDFCAIGFPKIDFNEQKSLAEFFSLISAEIDTLKALSDKYKTQKRGLMQKMLTGEWRVKPEIVNQYMEA